VPALVRAAAGTVVAAPMEAVVASMAAPAAVSGAPSVEGTAAAITDITAAGTVAGGVGGAVLALASTYRFCLGIMKRFGGAVYPITMRTTPTTSGMAV